MSNIDPTKPTYGQAFTSDVRQNFLYARDEIVALQTYTTTLPGYIDVTITTALKDYVPLIQKAQPLGVATLDSFGKLVSSQVPAAFTGSLSYRGGWNATTNIPIMASGALAGGVVQPTGSYYVVTVSGTTAAIDGITTWVAGDWIVSSGLIWQRVQNSTSPYLPLTGGTVGPGALNSSLLNIATSDLTKALQFTPQDDLPADIRIVDELGNVGVIITPGGAIDANLVNLTLTNTTLYEVVDGSNSIVVQDEFGFIALIIESNGIVDAGTLTANIITVSQTLNMPSAGTGGTVLSGSALQLANFSITESADGLNDVWFSDEFGFISFGIHGIDGSLVGGGSGGSGGGGGDPSIFDPALITSRDALATALSMAVRDNTNSKVAVPIWTYNLVISYGQSLSLGNGGGPPLSTSSGLGNLCLGTNCIGSQPIPSQVFTPVTDGNFHPLDGNARQEPPGVGVVNQWRLLNLRMRGLVDDTTHHFVFNCAGEGGKSIEELSKGNATGYYNKISSLITQCMSAATAAGGTFGVVAVHYIQGEANSTGGGGWDNTQAGYLAKLEQLRSDISTDIMALTGQKLPPAFLTVQTNSWWDHVRDDASIGMAQLQAATTAPYGDYMIAPNYQVNSDIALSGHLSNDGYRWLGNQSGYLLHKIIDKGQGWLPLYATGATFRGSQILITLHTPEPPLQAKQYYEGSDGSTPQALFSDYGFRAGDDVGVLNIASVTLYNSVILITCARVVSAANHPWVQYADRTVHNGNGNICDSDPFSSFDVFSSGTAASVGQNYPMWNWLVGFKLNVTSDV